MIATIRRHVAFAAVPAVVAALYFASGPSDRIGQLGGDWTWYLMMAASYSPFSAHDAVYAAAAQESRFPPLYPLLLALVGAAENLRWARVDTNTWGTSSRSPRQLFSMPSRRRVLSTDIA